MTLTPQEQQLLNNLLVGFTQDLDHTILNILYNIVIEDNKERDNILIKCCERYVETIDPFLLQMSKDKIGFGTYTKSVLYKYVASQLIDEELKNEFITKYSLQE